METPDWSIFDSGFISFSALGFAAGITIQILWEIQIMFDSPIASTNGLMGDIVSWGLLVKERVVTKVVQETALVGDQA